MSVQNLTELVTTQEGAVVSRVLLKNGGGNATLFAFGTGEELSEHTSNHDALVVLLEGEMTIGVGGEPHTLKADQMLEMPAEVPHWLRADSDSKMLLVMLKG